MQAIAEANGFSCGAVADVAVNKKQDLAVLAVQAEDYEAGGTIVFIGSDGTFKGMLECGVQPDMITFTPDGNYVITADKGPQKKGSHKDGEKAQGSVTIANISNGIPSEAKIVTFDKLTDRLMFWNRNRLLFPKTAKQRISPWGERMGSRF